MTARNEAKAAAEALLRAAELNGGGKSTEESNNNNDKAEAGDPPADENNDGGKKNGSAKSTETTTAPTVEAAAEPTGDSAAALDFLQHWAAGGPWVLSAIDPERKAGIMTQTFNTPRDALAFIKKWNGKRNLYFMVNGPRAPLSKKAAKEDVGSLNSYHTDVDPEPPPEGETNYNAHYESEQNRILQLLEEYEPKPSVILFSGGGYQGFWRMREPVEIEKPTTDNKTPWAQHEARNKKLEHDLTGGKLKCFNIDRIMRLPGTVNVPDEHKRKLGRKKTLAYVVSSNWESMRYSPANFEPYEESKSKPTAASGAKTTADTWVERVLKNGPDAKGKHSYDGDRSKALWAVMLVLMRRGMGDEEIVGRITDKANKISDHVFEQNGDPYKYAERQVAKAREKFDSDFERDDKNKIISNQPNIRKAFDLLGVRLSYDAFAQWDMIEGPEGKPQRIAEDADVDAVYLMIDERYYFRPPLEYFQKVISNECRAKSYHPLRDYLDARQREWDGTKRIDTWFVDYAGVEDTPYSRAVGRLMLVAAVRRVRKPGSKFDEMVVFESDEGLNKSSALETLAVREEWFSDSLPLDANEQKVIEALQGKWIIEAPELKGMNNKSREHLKAFLSRKTDRARMSYGRRPKQFPRENIIVGTTNYSNYLGGNTGNRRILPNKITKFDLDKLRADRDQLWAEAAAAEATGESIRLAPELYAAAAGEQQRRLVEDPWVSVLDAALAETPTGKILGIDLWLVVDIKVGMQNQTHNQRLGEAMKALGWEHKKLRFDGEVRWGYAKGPEEEIKKRIEISRFPNEYGIPTHLHVEYREIHIVDERSDAKKKAREQEIPF